MTSLFDAKASLKYIVAQALRNERDIYHKQPSEIPKIKEKIIAAFAFAEKAHRGVKREGGLPYIEHPAAVARMAAKLGAGSNAIIIAILHDVVEDCGIRLSEIEKRFGAEVAKGLDLVTKPKVIDGRPVFANKPEYWAGKDQSSDANWALRNSKFVERVVKSANIDALIVKLFDNFHNLKEISGLKPAKQMRYLSWIRVFVQLTRKTSPEMHRRFLELYVPLRKKVGIAKSQRVKMPKVSPQAEEALKQISSLLSMGKAHRTYKMPQKLRIRYNK